MLLAHCIGSGTVAQPAERYTYQYLTTADGLPSSEIICLLKDQSGFLWLGTAAGISRYDGYAFQNYSHAVSQELIGHVNVIKMDAAGRIWIGSTAGLYFHTGNSIIKLSAASAEAMGVNDVFIEGDTTVWLATENGPAKLAVKQIDFTGKRKTSIEQHILSGWVYPKDSTEQRSVLLISRSGDGAVFFSRRNDLFRLMNGEIEKLYTTARKRDQLQSIFPVSHAKIFFECASTEMNLFERGIVTAIPYKKFYQQGVQQGLPGLWYVGTRGAFYFHPQTATASVHLSFSDAYTIWPSAVLQDIGFFWVATHDGLVKLKPAVFSAAIVNDFYSLLEKKNGTLLLGANRGFIFERSSDSLIPYQQHVVPDAEVRAMYEDERGSIWIGTGYQGLVLLNNNRQWHFTKADGLHSNSLLCFSKTSNGGFYAAGDRGVTRINGDQEKSISFTPYYYSPNVSRHAKFFSII